MTRGTWAPPFLFLLTAMSALLPGAVRAQDTEADRQHARQLFEAGIGHADADDWSGAADLFRQSLAIRRSPSVAYNLASALSHLGHPGEAVELLEYAEQTATSPELRDSARQLRLELDPGVARLSVTLAGEATGVEVLVDSRPLAADRLSRPIPLDPGGHVVTARRGDREVAWQAIEVLQGASASVELQIPPAATAVRPVPPDVRPAAPIILVPPRRSLPPRRSRRSPTTHQASSSVLSRWWFWAAVGAVAAGATATAIVVSQPSGTDPYRGNIGPGSVDIP